MEKVEVTLIPYGTHQVAVPKNRIEYVLPYAKPLPMENAREGIVGSIIYQNMKTPVVDLLRLQPSAESPSVEENTPSRLVVAKALSRDLSFGSYAFIATGLPHIVNVSEQSLVEQTSELDMALFISEVRIEDNSTHDRCFILNVANFEQTLFS